MFLARKKANLSNTIRFALKSVYGMGRWRIQHLYNKFNIRHDRILHQLAISKREGLSTYSLKYTTGKDLKKKESRILKQHIQTGTYKGIRYQQGLPANGQRTHSNASICRLRLHLAKKIK